ncbi:hypothetical protein ZWY2020_005954 [Hordeum vulgare]|nr:hypothetical protein ZWY2020_005954 [Hordeum vulgare]
MTGLHGKHATSEPRRSKWQPERSRPDAKVTEPPARRAKRADVVHAPPRKRGSARVARPPHPLDSELGSEDAIAAIPPARRAEALRRAPFRQRASRYHLHPLTKKLATKGLELAVSARGLLLHSHAPGWDPPCAPCSCDDAVILTLDHSSPHHMSAFSDLTETWTALTWA